MQDINKYNWVERKQTQTQGYVSRFEPLALRLRLNHVKKFLYLHLGTPHRKQPLHKEWVQNQGANPTLHKRKHKEKAQSQKENEGTILNEHK